MHQGMGDDSVLHLPLRSVGPKFDDAAAKLMSHYERGIASGVSRSEGFEFGSTDATLRNPNQYFSGAGHWNLQIGDLERVPSGIKECSHVLMHLKLHAAGYRASLMV